MSRQKQIDEVGGWVMVVAQLALAGALRAR